MQLYANINVIKYLFKNPCPHMKQKFQQNLLKSHHFDFEPASLL